MIAVDLRGFGDSRNGPGDYDSTTAAQDLHELVVLLGLRPVHLCGQDVAGDTVFRFAATYLDDVISLTAIEMGLAGFGFEAVADVAHGGAWHIGALATSGVAEFVFNGRVRTYLADMWFPLMTNVPGAVTDADIDEFTRTHERSDAWRGCYGLYSSALSEGADIMALAASGNLQAPVLAVDALSTRSLELPSRTPPPAA